MATNLAVQPTVPDRSAPAAEYSSLNRVVAAATPLIALLAGTLAAWVGKHFPGVDLDSGQLTALIVAVVTTVLTMAVKWLHGWQRHEQDLRSARPAARHER